MKKWILLTVTAVLPISMMAQDDDMYFVPTKKNVQEAKKNYGMPRDTYYSGSNRSVDEYNRQAPSSAADNDIIDFSSERGVYPDSLQPYSGDYQLTRRMERFDDYTPSEAYWDGYRDGRWSSPWYYSSYYPWYDSWYDPWYYDAYWGWRYPGVYVGVSWGWQRAWGYYGWGRPWGWGYRGWYAPRYYSSHRMPASRSIRYYDRRNYGHDGSRRTIGGGRIDSRPGHVGSGSRSGSYGSGSRSGGNFGGGSRSSGGFSGGSGSRSSGSVGGGSRGGGGGRVGGGRR